MYRKEKGGSPRSVQNPDDDLVIVDIQGRDGARQVEFHRERAGSFHGSHFIEVFECG